jgi:hypothetical protein
MSKGAKNMSNLINPATGLPMSPPKPSVTAEEIINAFQIIQAKIDSMAQQQFGLSVLVEYMTDRMNMVAESGEVVQLKIDPQEFEPFFKERYEELVAEIEKMKTETNNLKTGQSEFPVAGQ